MSLLYLCCTYHVNSRLFVVQAKVLVGDGDYVGALENALTLRRVSRHLGNDTWAMWEGRSLLQHKALTVIQYVLGKMPPDANTLTWLQRELAALGVLEWHPRESLGRWRDRDAHASAGYA